MRPDYRTDRHDIDISKSGAAFIIMSSALQKSSDPTHNCPGPSPFLSDYVKYSFTVAATGWYSFVGAAQNGRFWTRVDDVDDGAKPTGRAVGERDVGVGGASNRGPTHVLAHRADRRPYCTRLHSGVAHAGELSRTTRRVRRRSTKDEVVVADAVATDPQFGAVPNRPSGDDTRPDPESPRHDRAQGWRHRVPTAGRLYRARSPLRARQRHPAGRLELGDFEAGPDDPGRQRLDPLVRHSVHHPGRHERGRDASRDLVSEPEHHAPAALSPDDLGRHARP